MVPRDRTQSRPGETEGLLLRRIERTRRQQSVLLRLSSENDPRLAERTRKLLHVDAEVLDVARVSYWSLHDDGELLRCDALYRAPEDRFESGTEIRSHDFPVYFNALRLGSPIVSHDVTTDPNMVELARGYLQAHQIGALLDVPVYVRGQLAGVVCHEHVGGPREWAVDEQQFAMSIAQLFALALETDGRAAAEDALRANEARFRAIVEASPVPMLVLSMPEGRCLYSNHAASELAGLPPQEMVGRKSEEFYFDAQDRAAVVTELKERGRIRGREVRIRRPDGSSLWVMLSVELVDFGGEKAAIVGFTDVTERRAFEERLRHTALHDPLTALPNRAYFMDMLRRELSRSERNADRRFAVLFVDLDGFKAINDLHGHEVGDFVLVSVAERLRSCLRPMDTAARMGGDEFTVILTDLRDSSDAVHVAERIENAIKAPIELEGLRVAVSASVGVVLDGSSYKHPKDLLHDADTAMYQAKERGKAQVFVHG